MPVTSATPLVLVAVTCIPSVCRVTLSPTPTVAESAGATPRVVSNSMYFCTSTHGTTPLSSTGPTHTWLGATAPLHSVTLPLASFSASPTW